jgi:magnesium transporter
MEQPVAVFPPHLTVGEATEQIRDLATTRLFTYGYITDATGVLLGVVTMRDLLLHQKADKLEDFMLRQPFSLRPEMDLMEAMRLTVNKHYPSYPVCDGRTCSSASSAVPGSSSSRPSRSAHRPARWWVSRRRSG